MCDSACSPLAAPSSFLLCVPLWWTGGHAELYNSSSSCRPSQLQPSWINASSCYCSNTIPRSLCCLCALYLQLPMLATVAVLSGSPDQAVSEQFCWPSHSRQWGRGRVSRPYHVQAAQMSKSSILQKHSQRVKFHPAKLSQKYSS